MQGASIPRAVDKPVVTWVVSESAGDMKSFFAADMFADTSIDVGSRVTPGLVADGRGISALPQRLIASPGETAGGDLRARVAVYDSPMAAPRIEDVFGENPSALIHALSQRVYDLAHSLGGAAPYTVLREVVENLIHAEFREIVVSIMDGGRTLRFADQGPGIGDKDRAMKPGYTTATVYMKDFIRGVGSGLPIVHEFLAREGGSVVLEDNLGRGTVVTLCFDRPDDVPDIPLQEDARGGRPDRMDVPPLSLRQKKVLSLVMELSEVGPTLVSKELSVGLSTAYRDLAALEEYGLIEADETGKRVLTGLGSAYLGRLFD